MHSYRAFVLFLTNALLVCRGALSLEDETKTAGGTKTDHQRTLGKIADDDETLKNILPLVTFECLGKSGYFADKKFDCEVFHYCDPDGSRSTFHCPKNFFFNSELMVCELISESKRSLCWKKEQGSYKDKKSINKGTTDAKLKILGGNKKNSEKYSAKYKGSIDEHLDEVSSDINLSLGSGIHNMGGMMTLEDMLSYMNSDSDSKHPKTFISTFLKTSGDRSAKALVNTSIIEPFKKLKDHSSAVGNRKDLDIQNTSPKERIAQTDFPAENSDTQETKPRKRKRGRRGRTLNSEDPWLKVSTGRHHSHVSVRSPAEHDAHDDQIEENQDYGPWEDAVSSTESSPSLRLFDIQSRRNSTDSWRKRRRHYRRRRKHKIQRPLPVVGENHQDNTTDVYGQSTGRLQQNYRRRGKKFDSAEWHRSTTPSSGTVKMQVPPINTSSFQVTNSRDANQPTHHNYQHTLKNRSHEFSEFSEIGNGEGKAAGGSHKNPWFKPTAATVEDDYNLRFGERTTTSGNVFAPEPYYGDENGSVSTSQFFDFEEKPDHNVNENPKTPAVPVGNTGQRWKLKSFSDMKSESSRTGTAKTSDRRPVDDEKRPTSEGQKISLTRHQKQEFAWNNQWSPMFSDVTTLPPTSPLKPSFSESSDPNIPADDDDDDDVIRWKQRDRSESKVKTKVPVGYSYKHWREEPKPHTQGKSTFNITSPGKQKYEIKSFPQSTRYIHRDRKKEWPKHTMAHQHLSKVMNDFLSIPPTSLRLPKVSPIASPVSFESYVPKYRIPNEDIYESESVAKEVVKNNPDIYDIVDLISKNARANLKETTKTTNPDFKDHHLTIKDAFLSMKSIGANKMKTTSGDMNISNLRETLEDILTTGLDKIIAKDHSKEYENSKNSPRIIKGSIRNLAELSKEEQEELKEITEIAQFTSLRLKPFLSSVLGERSKGQPGEEKTTADKKTTRHTILTAKKVPLRVLYSEDISTSKESVPKLVTVRPSVKVVRNRPPVRRFKMVRSPPPVPQANVPFMILHPPSLRPPHPPPLLPPKHTYPGMHIPYAGLRPSLYHHRHPYIPRRRKRSPQLQRYLGTRKWNNNPFARGIIPPFTSAYGSPLFRRPFTPQRFPIPSLPNPFRFSYPLSGNTGVVQQRKPRLRKPVFLPRQPVQNIPQPAHQTVIIEEVPVPIPVQVPDHSASRVPVRNPLRVAETVRAQRPLYPQDQRAQSTALMKPVQFQHPPYPFGIGVLEASPQSRPPPSMYSQPTIPGQGIGSSTLVREPKFQYALPVAQSPAGSFPQRINPNSNRNSRNRDAKPKAPVILTPSEFHKLSNSPQFALSFDTKNLHMNSYPNFPYFQSGPPTTFAHFLSPVKENKLENSDNRNRNSNPPKPSREVQSRPVFTRPGKVFDVDYREAGSRGNTPSNMGVTSSPGGLFVVSPPDSSTFSYYLAPNSENSQNEPSNQFNWSEESKESLENGFANQRPKVGTGVSSRERKNRRRRPGSRRRRPRPNVSQEVFNGSTTKSVDPSDVKPSLNAWTSSNPPEQIPPPPSEMANDPVSLDIQDPENADIQNEERRNAINSFSVNIPNSGGLNVSDVRNVFPTAGYYGSEQLSQILETSFSSSGPGSRTVTHADSSEEIKLPTLTITEQPLEVYNMFSQEDAAFYDGEDGGHDGVPFGTRLKNKPRSRVNSRQNMKLGIDSMEAPKSVRNMQSGSSTQQRYHMNRGTSQHEPGSQRSSVRDAAQPPRRRKPGRLRYPESNDKPNKPQEVRGIRPEVIYYDTREHPDGLFKIQSDIRDTKPASPVLLRSHQGTREIFHLPNPYADRDLFGIHPPTSKPVLSTAFPVATPPRSLPRERKKDFAIPRRPQSDHALGEGPFDSNIPTRASNLRQGENANTQQQYRSRERKRPTVQPKTKTEMRTSSLIAETTTTRPRLYSTQEDHKTKEFQKSPEYPYYQHKLSPPVSPKDTVTQKWTVKTTATVSPFTEPVSFKVDEVATTTMANLEIKTTVDKPVGFLPVRELPRAIQGTKLDLGKINATISTSVSVSSSSSSGNHLSSVETSAEGQAKKVFSSKNGGLAVVRKGTRQRKRNRNRLRTTAIPKVEDASSGENGLNEHEKLQIAASIHDIIKATSESERTQDTSPSVTDAMNSTTSVSKVSKKWILPPPEDVSQSKNIT